MTRWVCSDHHWDHENIIKFCDRPFQTVQEMNDRLLEWHNSYVKPSDHVYFLGDLTMHRDSEHEAEFIKYFRRYNGHKTLFLGNHDHYKLKTYVDAGFKQIRATWRDEQTNVIFSHIPIHPRSLSTARANVHGHIHNVADYGAHVVYVKDEIFVKPYINTSLEVTDYRPLSFDEMETRIAQAKVGATAILKPEDM